MEMDMDINRCKLVIVSLFMITICFCLLQLPTLASSRGISVISDLSHKSGKLGTYKALIIGINDYSDPTIPDLETALNDANAMAKLLRERYGFQVKLLLDRKATRKAIYQALRNLASSAKPDDNVLIYYAGHGDLDRLSDDGWWIPADAKGGDPVTYLDNFLVQKYIRSMQARHVLLISDSCYSGTLFGQARAMPPVIDDKYYLNLYNEKSRWGMTSGNKTPVSDRGTGSHSVFAYQLLKELRKNEKPFVSTQEIYTRIAPIVGNNSEQTPLCRPIRNTGDQGGEFVFVASSMGAEKEKYFIYKYIKKYGMFEFAKELNTQNFKNKSYYHVIYDEYGRKIKIERFINGEIISSILYEYKGDSQYYYKLTHLDQNEKEEGYLMFYRDVGGLLKKLENRTSDGTLTSYIIFENSHMKTKYKIFNGKGALQRRGEDYFNSRGVLIKRVQWFSKENYIEAIIDDKTGLEVQENKFRNGKLDGTTKIKYDEYGNILLKTFYNSISGKSYGKSEFKNGLRQTDMWKISHESRKLTYEYDDARNVIKAFFTVNDKFICRFVYSRYPNGDIEKTIAYNKDGEIIAEYPNAMVKYIQKDGKDEKGRKSLLYKEGPLW
jgi:Caspase domain